MNLNQINTRIETLDFLRGFALIGIMLVNIVVIANIGIPESSQDITYKKFLDFFIESKFFSIFSYLFGIGFYIFMQRAEEKPGNKYFIYLRRILILAIFGLIHMQLQPGEALVVYSIFGLLLIPFFNLNKFINLVIGILLLIMVLYLDAKILTPLPYFILGLASAQFGMIFKFNRYKIWSVVALISGIISTIGWYLLEKAYVVPNFKLLRQKSEVSINHYAENVDHYHHLITIFSPFMSIFYASCLILLLNISWARKVLSPLKYYGSMALTNYIGQTLLIYLAISIFSGKHWTHVDTLWICVCVYVFQLLISTYWLKYFKLGPLEYIWKIATYMKKIKIIK